MRLGDPTKTRPQKAVRVAFYIWLSMLNLISTSLLWARMADSFDSAAALRLFGWAAFAISLSLSLPCSIRLQHCSEVVSGIVMLCLHAMWHACTQGDDETGLW